MPWINDSEFTRSSVCMAKRDTKGYIVALFRILDYQKSLSGDESYTWVYRNDRNTKRPDPDDPRTLFRQETLDALHETGEDFLFIQWKPNAEKPNRPLIRDPYTRPYSPAPEYYEIINSPANSLPELRKNLQQGWPYSGTPSRRVLVIYAEQNNKLETVLLDRDSLDYSNNQIRLKYSAPLGAERYDLSINDVRYLPENPTDIGYKRAMYTKLFLPRAKGKILVQPLSRYALHYMQWYADHVRSSISESDGQRLAEIVRQAFETPERLEEFDTALSPMDVQRLRTTITRFISDDNQMAKLVKDTLSSDDAFKRSCIMACREEALSDVEGERDRRMAKLNDEIGAERTRLEQQIQLKHDELTQLEERIRSRSDSYERLTQLVSPLQKQVDELNRKLESDKAAITSIHKRKEAELAEFAQRKTKELAELERQKDAVLNRLDEDVTLKLGLRSVVKSMMSVQTIDERTVNRQTNGMPADDAGDKSATRLHPTLYPTLPAQQSEASFTRTLADNLRSYGIVSVDKPAEAPNELASACTHILSATRLLAIDSAFAAGFANALAYAMRGEPARHVSVPADWNDACELDHLLKETGDGVLVLDGVFDTVNEGLLFALSRLRHDATIILPIGAYGNLRLIATEVWNGVFYLPTEQYVPMPVDNVSVRQSAEALPRSNAEARSILTTATSMRKNTSLPLASLMLPASVAARFRWPSDGGRWTSAHIALQTSSTSGPDKALGLAGDGEESTSAGMLLSRIGRGHDDR